MILELVLVIACGVVSHGGVIQQQALAVPAVAGQYATAVASSYRRDRPLQDQFSIAPEAYARISPAPNFAVASGPITAPLGGQLAHIAARFEAPLASSPIGLAQLAPRAQAVLPAPVAAPAPLIKTLAAAPVAPLTKAVVSEEYDPNPQYSYSYDVQDSLTGDNKNQIETRNGDVVQGSYSLNDPDGSRRIVEYTADPINGFNAVVRREPQGAKALIAAAPSIAKVAAPIPAIAIAKIAAPAVYSSPIGLSNTIYH